MSAELLCNFENKKSKKTLLKLVCDKKSLVRTEANLLRGFMEGSLLEPDDQALVKKSLEKLVEKEETRAVKANALLLLDMLGSEKVKE